MATRRRTVLKKRRAKSAPTRIRVHVTDELDRRIRSWEFDLGDIERVLAKMEASGLSKIEQAQVFLDLTNDLGYEVHKIISGALQSREKDRG